MKKLKMVFLCVVLFIRNEALISQNQQSAFYDAKFIYDSCFSVQDSAFINQLSLYDILTAKYYPTGTVLSEQELRKNPFFAPYIPVSISLSIAGKSSFVDKGLAAVEGLDVTKYANAIANLMIQRAKQELTIAFFNRFKKFAGENEEFQILFPKTTDNLSNLLTYTYPQMLPQLREGFFEDLKQLTYNLEALLDSPRYRTLLDNFPEIRIAIRFLKLIHELENGDLTTDKLITEFAAFPEWTNDSKGSMAFKNTGTTIQFAALVSESLRHKDKSRIWISQKEAKDLINNEVLASIYLGLLYQQVVNKGLLYLLNSNDKSEETLMKDLFAKQKDNILLMQNKISQFVTLADQVQIVYARINDKNNLNQKNSADDYVAYIGVSIDIVEYSFSIVKLFDENLEADNYLTIAKKTNSLYKDIASTRYTLAVNDAMDILKNIDTLIHKKKYSDIINSSVMNALPANDAFDKFLMFTNKVRPYALFMGNMVEAKDENEIQASLANVVLPVGSSTIKKNTVGWWGNISVQAYLGAYGSIHSPTSSVQSAWTDKFGVIAPIGISWTPGCFSWRQGGSLSLFVSVFDIGAIVDYKLKKDSAIADNGTEEEAVSKDYKIQLGQILSPGGYLVYGFPWNLPLSFGIGAQYGPGLSKIEAGANAVVTNPSIRWNAFLAVDIPLFNIKNKNNLKPSK